MWKCQWPEMHTKLLKNGKWQQTVPPPPILSTIFFFSLSFLFWNNKPVRSTAGKLTALPIQLWGESREVWLKQGQKRARCFWLLWGYPWPTLHCRSFWVCPSQCKLHHSKSSLANSTLISLALSVSRVAAECFFCSFLWQAVTCTTSSSSAACPTEVHTLHSLILFPSSILL